MKEVQTTEVNGEDEKYEMEEDGTIKVWPNGCMGEARAEVEKEALGGTY